MARARSQHLGTAADDGLIELDPATLAGPTDREVAFLHPDCVTRFVAPQRLAAVAGGPPFTVVLERVPPQVFHVVDRAGGAVAGAIVEVARSGRFDVEGGVDGWCGSAPDRLYRAVTDESGSVRIALIPGTYGFRVSKGIGWSGHRASLRSPAAMPRGPIRLVIARVHYAGIEVHDDDLLAYSGGRFDALSLAESGAGRLGELRRQRYATLGQGLDCLPPERATAIVRDRTAAVGCRTDEQLVRLRPCMSTGPQEVSVRLEWL